jgi:hypothetical protein
MTFDPVETAPRERFRAADLDLSLGGVRVR